MEKSQPDPAVSGVVVTTPCVLRLAVAAYLARFKGQSRIHTESDLRGYLVWCELRGLDPLAASRPHDLAHHALRCSATRVSCLQRLCGYRSVGACLCGQRFSLDDIM